MGTLYIDRSRSELRHDAGTLTLYLDGARSSSVPVALLDRVVIRGSVLLTTGVLGALAEAGVGVVILSGRHGRNIAQLVGRPRANARVRISQYQLYLQPEERLAWGRGVVAGKLRLQQRLLEGACEQRPDLRHPLTSALKTLESILAQVLACEPTDDPLRALASLVGLEGAAGAAYFSGYTALFPPAVEFRNRNRRPPRDPVNACLSLAYTLLHSEAVQACYGAGLDPMIGFYHALAPGRESLASDLIEALRPRADAWVWELFRTRRLRAEHFSAQPDGACLLGKAGRAAFYEDYEGFMRSLRRLLRMRCAALARQLAIFAELSGGLPEDTTD